MPHPPHREAPDGFDIGPDRPAGLSARARAILAFAAFAIVGSGAVAWDYMAGSDARQASEAELRGDPAPGGAEAGGLAAPVSAEGASSVNATSSPPIALPSP